MIIKITAFTAKGDALIEKIQLHKNNYVFEKRAEEALPSWTKEAFEKAYPIIFVGATGIAVRAIAPYVKDKLQDSPVLVIDEMGTYVIPILSGHMGGANVLATEIAKAIGAKAVLTTATDVAQAFAVDIFAKKNGFAIGNREGIQKVSSKVLEGERLSVSVEPTILYMPDDIPEEIELVAYPPKNPVDILISSDMDADECLLRLLPKPYVIGIGCKKGKTEEEIEAFVTQMLGNVSWNEIYAIASIDLKKDERGLVELSQMKKVPFYTFSSQELLAVSGDFSDSEFVKETTGVANVCERAALCCAGETVELISKKQANQGMTFAMAWRQPRIHTWETSYE